MDKPTSCAKVNTKTSNIQGVKTRNDTSTIGTAYPGSSVLTAHMEREEPSNLGNVVEVSNESTILDRVSQSSQSQIQTQVVDAGGEDALVDDTPEAPQAIHDTTDSSAIDNNGIHDEVRVEMDEVYQD